MMANTGVSLALTKIYFKIAQACSSFLFPLVLFFQYVGLFFDALLYFIAVYLYDNKNYNIPAVFVRYSLYFLKVFPLLLLTVVVWTRVFKKKYQFLLDVSGPDEEKFIAVLLKSGLSFIIPAVGISVAHIFSAFGDLFLARSTYDPHSNAEMNFGLGVISFMIAQVCFGLTFSIRFVVDRRGVQFTPLKPFHYIPFAVYGILLYFLIIFYGDVSLSFPIQVVIALYAFFITFMGWRALAQYSESSQKKYAFYRLMGAIIFISSDSMIALTSFLSVPFKDGLSVIFPNIHTDERLYRLICSLAIMITYWVAQLLISMSVTETTLDHNLMVRRQLKIV